MLQSHVRFGNRLPWRGHRRSRVGVDSHIDPPTPRHGLPSCYSFLHRPVGGGTGYMQGTDTSVPPVVLSVVTGPLPRARPRVLIPTSAYPPLT